MDAGVGYQGQLIFGLNFNNTQYDTHKRMPIAYFHRIECTTGKSPQCLASAKIETTTGKYNRHNPIVLHFIAPITM